MGVRSDSMCSLANTASNAAMNFVSRSRIKNLNSDPVFGTHRIGQFG
jgi:hypothetical protein